MLGHLFQLLNLKAKFPSCVYSTDGLPHICDNNLVGDGILVLLEFAVPP